MGHHRPINAPINIALPPGQNVAMNARETAKELFFQALELVECDDFPNAKSRLRDALALAPGHAAILANLSGVLFRQNRRAEARDIAGAALAADPESVEALLILAQCHSSDTDPFEALAAYDKVVALDPTIAEAHNNRGIILQKLGRSAEALASYDRAIALNPGLAQAWLGRGNALDRSKRYDEALLAYAQALRLSPDLTYAWLGRGNILCKLKRHDEGIAAYEKALASEPGLAEAWLGRGNALRDLRRYEDALAAFDRALTLQPGLTGAWLGRGHVFQERKCHDEALAAFDQALARDADSIHAWLGRAEVLRALKRRPESIAAYRQALKLGGDVDLINYNLAGLGAEPQPAAAPEHYVVGLFDSYADQFDQDLVGNLKYRTPKLLANTISRLATADRLDILDLGCGTGLMGEELRPLKRTLTGVDLSPNMLERARQRGIYDELIAQDLIKYLAAQRHAFDIAVAADVLAYIGDLSSVFGGLRQALRDRGLFCFSVERVDEGDFVLRGTLRYAHSIDYLRALAQQHRFIVETVETHVLRQDAGADINGCLAVMRLSC